MKQRIFNLNRLELLLENIEDQLLLIKDENRFKELFTSYLIFRNSYRHIYLLQNSERSEDYIEKVSQNAKN